MSPSPPRPAAEAVTDVDVCVVGAGQSALSLAYHLRREARRDPDRAPTFVLLDDRDRRGGAWTDGWDTLALFSPAAYSSLAGWPMPAWRGEGNPSGRHVADYLAAYEERYELPVRRPVRVTGIEGAGPDPGARLDVRTDTAQTWSAAVVVSATGTWARPFWPAVPGTDAFEGAQLHAAQYRRPDDVPGPTVAVVGGSNSAAQIAADLAIHSDHRVLWCARDEPAFLPDEIDGRALFATATQAVRARDHGIADDGVASLGDIVAVPSVRHARDSLGLRARPMFDRLTPTGAAWPDGSAEDIATVIWCTGFRPALAHLDGSGLARTQGHPATAAAGVSVSDPRFWFVGYGDWCALASATLIGVNRQAKEAAAGIVRHLRGPARR